MLAKHHPSEPVPAEEEDRAQPDGEIPVRRRRETGEERADVMPGDGAEAVWPAAGGIAASVVGTIAASPRNGAAIAVAMRGARAWASSAASITEVTATTIAPPPPLHPPGGEHRPGRRGDQRDAERQRRPRSCSSGPAAGCGRAPSQLDGAVDVGVHAVSRSPSCVRPSRARRRAGPPTSRARDAMPRECAAPVPGLRMRSAR